MLTYNGKRKLTLRLVDTCICLCLTSDTIHVYMHALFSKFTKTPIIAIAFSFMSRLVFFMSRNKGQFFFVQKTLINKEWKWHTDLKTQMFQFFISCIIGLLLCSPYASIRFILENS